MLTPEQMALLLEAKAENLLHDAERFEAQIERTGSDDFRRGYAAALRHNVDLLRALAQLLRTQGAG